MGLFDENSPGYKLFLKPLGDAIRMQLLPSISGHPGCSADERDLLSLPCCFGGLGLINPTKVSDSQFDASLLITASLKDLIIKQSVCAQPPDVRSAKAQVHLNRRRTRNACKRSIFSLPNFKGWLI